MSVGSTSNVIVFPINVFTKICIPMIAVCCNTCKVSAQVTTLYCKCYIINYCITMPMLILYSRYFDDRHHDCIGSMLSCSNSSVIIVFCLQLGLLSFKFQVPKTKTFPRKPFNMSLHLTSSDFCYVLLVQNMWQRFRSVWSLPLNHMLLNYMYAYDGIG